MSIFRRENEEPPATAERRRQTTLIAPGSLVTGRITGPTELLVEGEIEGDLEIDGVITVGSEGRVRGEIAGKVVRVGGRVVGNVRGGERVEVLATGALEGDVSAPRVTIAEGAFFKGRVEMGGAKSDGPVPAPDKLSP